MISEALALHNCDCCGLLLPFPTPDVQGQAISPTNIPAELSRMLFLNDAQNVVDQRQGIWHCAPHYNDKVKSPNTNPWA